MIKPATDVGLNHPARDPSTIPVTNRVSRKRRSPYRELLERLLDSPKNSVLRVRNIGARYAFRKQAHVLGYEALFAQHDGWLYIKLGGVLNQTMQSGGQGAATVHKSVMEAVAQVPMTAKEVARVLGSDSASCEAILSYLVRAGLVERDDGLGNQAIYRAM
jgi:hypothetical protein